MLGESSSMKFLLGELILSPCREFVGLLKLEQISSQILNSRQSDLQVCLY